MSDKQQIKEMAQENVRATGRALEHLRLPHNPDFYYAGNTFNLALDVINALERALQAETARADKLAAALKELRQSWIFIQAISGEAGEHYQQQPHALQELFDSTPNSRPRIIEQADAALSTPRAKEHTAP